ncbi:MAG: S49 family peptidase [Pseudomonadota bacterium]
MASMRSLLAALPIRRFRNPPPLVPVVRLEGVIGRGRTGRGQGLSLADMAGQIQKAFAIDDAPAVALIINSPGGSPVQSALIARRIRDLAEEKQKPVLAFVEDVAASGGYWLACAADEIFADNSSIVGSIGVIAATFGLSDLIDRWGIERRVYTAGDRKLILDPFQPEKEADVARVKDLQQRIHQDFIAHVQSRRGDRLTGAPEQLFNGDIWVGQEAQNLGLIDGIGHLRPILRERFGDKVKMKVFGPQRGLLRRFGLMDSSSIGEAAIGGALASMEERALWQRYGL